MGLRIGTNLGALQALRSLRGADAARAQSLAQLASGRRINRGSDDPSGLVLLEQLNAENRAISQAIENSQSASALVTTADAGLGEVADLLVGMKAEVIASLNTGALSPTQQRALQNSIDQRLNAIDRIASTTRFGDRSLLNGTLDFNLTGAGPGFTDVRVDTVNTPNPFPLTVDVTVISAATQAQAGGAIAAGPQSGAAVFTVQGDRGSQQITIADGATQQNVIDAINAVTDFTGVEATGAGVIRSSQVGSESSVRIEFNSGDLDGVSEGLTFGTDVQAVVNGASVTGQGDTLRVQDGTFSGQITLQGGFTGSTAFTIEGGGARFQTGTGSSDAIQVGFAAAGAGTLGRSSGAGTLSSLRTGGANSLASDPAGALAIIDAAQTEVSTQRANLGALESQLLESNRRALGVHLENLTASASRIGDLDFAEGISRRTRDEVIFQSALSVLRSANLNAGNVLKLLG